MPDYPFEIITTAGLLHRGRAEHVQAPGWDGLLGVLDRHIPMICGTRHGVVTLTAEDGTRSWFAVSDGALEVRRDKVLLLASWGARADSAEKAKALVTEALAREGLSKKG